MEDEPITSTDEHIDALKGGIMEIEFHQKRHDRLWKKFNFAAGSIFAGIILTAPKVANLVANIQNPDKFTETAAPIGLGLLTYGLINAFRHYRKIAKYDHWGE